MTRMLVQLWPDNNHKGRWDSRHSSSSITLATSLILEVVFSLIDLCGAGILDDSV